MHNPPTRGRRDETHIVLVRVGDASRKTCTDRGERTLLSCFCKNSPPSPEADHPDRRPFVIHDVCVVLYPSRSSSCCCLKTPIVDFVVMISCAWCSAVSLERVDGSVKTIPQNSENLGGASVVFPTRCFDSSAAGKRRVHKRFTILLIILSRITRYYAYYIQWLFQIISLSIQSYTYI